VKRHAGQPSSSAAGHRPRQLQRRHPPGSHNTGVSDYNGLQLELRSNQLWHQLTLRTNYTYSKTTDNVDDIFGPD